MTPANLVSYSAQVAALVLFCAAVPRVLGLRSPGLQYLFWRALLAVCLLLPIVEPWQTHEMAFVPAPAAFASSAVPGSTIPAMSDGMPSFAAFARETVVDELSILTTNTRRAYLDALLAFADDTGLASTPAFSARRHLFHRVMLLSKEGTMSSSRIAVAACVLVAALGSGAWGAVHAFPLSRTVIVSGAQDQNLPGDPTIGQQTRTTPGQLPPPPPASVDAQGTEPPMPADFKAALDRLKPVRLGKNVAPPPATTKSVKAAYPEEARAAHVQGEVLLETIIDADGKVAAVRVIRSVPGLDEAATDAAKRWVLTPALLNGTPTPVLMTMVMNFTLK
ncbi:MAG TPA: energy transducer TonB [Vicinamibacterales bacterium]|jgi:TonB family protein|nr:energy transducer TonB [Vicinamibacterales bacterium]